MAGEGEEEVYQGVVSKLSRDGAQYIIECAVVSEWYKTPARLDAEWAPEGLEIGDTVRFTVAPAVSWIERRNPKKRKAEEVAKAASDEVAQLRAQLAQEREAKLEAQLAATKMELAHVTQRGAAAAAPAGAGARLAAAAGAAGAAGEDYDGNPRVAGRKAARPPPTIAGSVRFETGDFALSALALFGTKLNGRQIKVELDTANLSLVRVTNLSEDTTAEQLWAHFERTGRMECAQAGADKKLSKAALKGLEQSQEKRTKGKGRKDAGKGGKGGKDSGKGGKDASKSGKDAGKGTAAAGTGPLTGKSKAPVAGGWAWSKGPGVAPSAKGKSKGA